MLKICYHGKLQELYTQALLILTFGITAQYGVVLALMKSNSCKSFRIVLPEFYK